MEKQKEYLPTKKKEDTLRQLFDNPALKRQVALAIPGHMTVDRLLRVAMTAIRTNPKLMECTPKSLMACLMGCAQLGLEPEPFLGQAYLVPFKNKFDQQEAQLIPGYRGYITLARRSGEVQSVSAQVVYANDRFHLQYGLNESLDHMPADGDRGEVKGAYVVFRYKDGSHSFDFMTKGQIDKIRERSKAKDSGPWVTDYEEMAKKTVIRRHIKLAPLSIEMAKAASLEENAMIGEDQASLIFQGNGDQPELMEPEVPAFEDIVAKQPGLHDPAKVHDFLEATAQGNDCTVEEVREMARRDFQSFWNSFLRWKTGQGKAKHSGKGKDANQTEKTQPRDAQEASNSRPPDTLITCPDRAEDDKPTLGYCNQNCDRRVGCPAFGYPAGE